LSHLAEFKDRLFLTFATQTKRKMNTILLFGMPGGAELFFIVLVIIMLFGSKKIPELARGLGKGMREIKNATGDIQREITEGAREVNSMKDKVNVEKQVKDLIQGDKEKKESEAKTSDSSEISEEKSKPENQKSEVKTEKPEPISQTVQRRSPYKTNEPKSNSDLKE
jgi:sec-independent protein translocase protein TatA